MAKKLSGSSQNLLYMVRLSFHDPRAPIDYVNEIENSLN